MILAVLLLAALLADDPAEFRLRSSALTQFLSVTTMPRALLFRVMRLLLLRLPEPRAVRMVCLSPGFMPQNRV